MLGFFKTKKADVLSFWYAPFALLPQKGLLLFALIFILCPCRAQQPDNFRELYATADSQLNAVYQRALPRLTSPNQEILRRAEQAWMDFSDKEMTLVDALQNENLVPNEFAHADILVETKTRTSHLQIYFLANSIPYAEPYVLQNVNQVLSRTYAECLSRMSDNDRALLLSSERSWLAYRDADAASVMTTYGNETVETSAEAHLTAMRNAQLISLVQSVKYVPAVESPAEVSPAPLQSSSPNLEDVTAISQFQNDAKGVLISLLAKKDDPFFKSPDTIKNVPDLPSDIPDQISKLNAQYHSLSRNPDSAKLFESALNESATVELLVSWSHFTQDLKSGNVDDAGSVIQTAVDQKPKGMTADYLPLWQAVESWQKVFLTDENAFNEHIQKAQSFANLGKTSAAIKEYQAAYDIIGDATIPEKIKTLQDQSLGL